MEKKNSTVLEYHQSVWAAAKTDTELYFRSDWRGWFGGIISGIASGAFSAWLSNLGGNMSIIGWIVAIVGILAGTVLGWAIFVISLYGVNGLWLTPYRQKEDLEKLYKSEKAINDRTSWNNVRIDTKTLLNGLEFKGYSILIENNKAQDYCFQIELQWLEVDGVSKKPAPNKKRIQVWAPNGVLSMYGLEHGICLNPADSSRIGLWELLFITESPSGKKYRIVFGHCDEKSTKPPEKEYTEFLSSAKGELKLYGHHVGATFNMGYVSKGYFKEHLQGNPVYSFSINIGDGEPKISLVKGALDFHAELEDKESTDEEG